MKAASPCSSSSSVTTSLGDVRSERERPDPSTIRGDIPSSPSSSVATCAPAAVLPAPPYREPTTLISVSAMKLSDGWFIWRSRSASGAERHAPTGTASVAVRPRRAPRATSTPRWRSCFAKNVAAKLAGRFWKYGALRPVRPRLNVRAESGPPTSELEREARRRDAAAGVERRLVPDHAARDPADPRLGHLLGEVAGVDDVEVRVAAAAEVEVAPDHAGGGRRLGQRLGGEPRGRPHPPQRGRGRVELLDRGRHPRRPRADRVELAARLEVDDVRAGAGARLAHLRRERLHRARAARRLGGGRREQEGEQAGERDEPGHRSGHRGYGTRRTRESRPPLASWGVACRSTSPPTSPDWASSIPGRRAPRACGRCTRPMSSGSPTRRSRSSSAGRRRSTRASRRRGSWSAAAAATATTSTAPSRCCSRRSGTTSSGTAPGSRSAPIRARSPPSAPTTSR